MKRLLVRIFLVSALAPLLLQGCSAIAPGFDAPDRTFPVTDPRPVNTFPSTGAPASGERPPPEGAITQITPQLLRVQQAARPRVLAPNIQALLGEPTVYTLGPGDVVGITVFDHPELISNALPATTVADPSSVSPAPGFIVSNTGQLSFPFAGTLRVVGMTVQELEDMLTRRLTRVFKDPQVSVRVQAFRSKRAYVEGEVRVPGLQVFTDIPMTLPEVIQRAGGILQSGDRSFVTLTRNGVTTPIDLMALAETGVDPTRIPLRDGDMVTVRNREDSKVTVIGEVVRPQALLMRNGRLSLNDALGEVGGVDLGTSNPRQIFVVRNEPAGGQSIYHLDARTPAALAMADNFALKPKDVVYVDSVALVTWNRVVSLILPSAVGVNQVRGTYR